jgi:hypothetical protein
MNIAQNRWHRQERDAAALKIKKEAAYKRARSSTVEADEDDEVEIVEAPRRKRRRGNDEEIIVLDWVCVI